MALLIIITVASILLIGYIYYMRSRDRLAASSFSSMLLEPRSVRSEIRACKDPPPPPPPPIYDDIVLDPNLRIAYMTDCEGNWEYFLGFIARSDALRLVGIEEGGSVARINLADGWRFIFGGDACDKGGFIGGSVRVTRSLLLLKQRYPSRVTLLLGNRDINKMRLTSELEASQLEDALLEHLPGPHWVPDPKRSTPASYLRQRKAARLSIPPEEVSDEQLRAANTMANRLRYILEETMGAGGELERRAAELDLVLSRSIEPRASAAKAAVAALIGNDETDDDETLSTADAGEDAAGKAEEGEESASIRRAVASFQVAAAAGGFYRKYILSGELGALCMHAACLLARRRT